MRIRTTFLAEEKRKKSTRKLHERDRNSNEMVFEQWTLCQQKED
jgi:hypothetical protein